MHHRPIVSKDAQVDPSVLRRFTRDLTSVISEAGTLFPAEEFKFKYLLSEMLSKYCEPSPESASDRRTAAIAKWRGAELRNATTNERLQSDLRVTFNRRRKPFTSDDVIRVARLTILRVLGVEPCMDVLYGTFTTGASTSFRRGPESVSAKFKEGADVTSPASVFFRAIEGTCETWMMYREYKSTRDVSGSVLFTVPKNSEIDRAAAKEPDLNLFLQKGVGAFIRKRLKSVLHVDLNDQTRNQNLARQGSLTGLLATLDLSSASDLISRELVRLVLPELWFDLLDSIRSQAIVVDGELIPLNMFSSMGNGFTFELESLIFWAITNAVCYLTGIRGTISVYGDDIILPRDAAPLVGRVLAFFGFKLNSKKSFWRGPFRESCGKHWYKGVDVTPFYIKEPVSSVMRLIHLLNRLRAWATCPGTDVVDPRFYNLWKRYSKAVPTALYGGWDCDRIDSLVTYHAPRMRLSPKTKAVRVDSCGGYLQWLRTTDGRTGTIEDPIITSVVKVEVGVTLTRQSVYFGECRALFPQEIARESLTPMW